MDLKFYFNVLLRRLPLILILTFLGAGIGVTLALLLPAVYRAEARLVVESEQIPDELAASTVQVEASEQLEIIQQRILTRDVLVEMANRLAIYAPRPGQAERRMSAEEIVDDMRERIGIVTTGGAPTNARQPRQATILAVSFEAPTSQMAAAVANELVTLILQENVEMRTRTAGQTLDFFIQEVERLDLELTERGGAIEAFQVANREALPDSLEFRRGQLVAEQERLLQLQRDEAALRDRRDRLVELYENTGQVSPGPEEEPQTQEERELQSLRNQLAGLLGVLSPTNPRIALLQSQVAALEARVLAARGELPEAGPAGPSAFELQLADIDTQIQSLAAQRATGEARLAALQESIAATPSNAMALEELQRDFDNLRAQYDLAVQRRSLAETGEMIETLSRGQRISVIEQAIPPDEPQSPNRPLIAGAGTAIGLALGIGLFLLLEVTDRSIRRPNDLSARLGIAPFAVVPLMRSAFDVRRRRLRIAGALAVVLVLIPGGLWLIHSQVMPLDLVADRLIERLAAGLQAAQGALG